MASAAAAPATSAAPLHDQYCWRSGDQRSRRVGDRRDQRGFEPTALIPGDEPGSYDDPLW